MRTLAAIQSIFAVAFILLGLVALFGIGITGLLFLLVGAIFAGVTGIVAEGSRAAIVLALAADAALAWIAARKLGALITLDKFDPAAGVPPHPGLLDYLLPSTVLALVAIGILGVCMDWRALRTAKWF